MSGDRTVKDFFDPTLYGKSLAPSKCWGCGRAWGRCDSDLATRREFAEMTGLLGLHVRRLSLNLSGDCRSLGLDAARVPERIDLCVGCAVAYMRQFNERLAEAKGASA